MSPPIRPARSPVGPERVGFTDRGSATAELAVGLPALLMLLLAGLAAVGAVTTQLRCVDASRDAVLAASRGEAGTQAGQRAAPPGAEVTVTASGDTVTATVRAPVPLLGGHLPALRVNATAVAGIEPGSPGPAL
ncbi:MAG: mucin-associated surface protein [Micromonosporaceae bacterium]|nr:mucin-associated surface protein [Micromonosporaceae bacterium]